MDEVLGVADELDAGSPSGPVVPPEGFAIEAGDIESGTPSSTNLQ